METERHVIFDTLDQFPNIHQAVEANEKLKESLSKRTTVLKIVVLETAEPRSGYKRNIILLAFCKKSGSLPGKSMTPQLGGYWSLFYINSPLH